MTHLTRGLHLEGEKLALNTARLNYLRRAVISKMFLDAYAEVEEKKNIMLIVNASSSLTACRGRRGMTSGCEYQLGTHHGNL